MSYVSVPLRRLVTQRAEEQCEYCRYPQAASFFTFEIEHIIAEKRDGITEIDLETAWIRIEILAELLVKPQPNLAIATTIKALQPHLSSTQVFQKHSLYLTVIRNQLSYWLRLFPDWDMKKSKK